MSNRPGINSQYFDTDKSYFLFDGGKYLGKGGIKTHTVFPYIGLHHFKAVQIDKHCYKLTGYLYSNKIDILLVGKSNYKEFKK